ncbi:hypothetical protein [Shigella sp. FC1967]|nr:hypothetical protein [Shigella sp. FC1967]
MSDKLFQKRKAKKIAELGRKSAKKESYDRILIVTEGEKNRAQLF